MPNTQDISEVLTEDAWRLSSQPYADGTPYFVFEAGKGFFGRTDAPQGFRFSAIMSESNARLIVAAPDLLRACEDCMENRGDWGALMSDAIRKARGEPQ